MYNINLIPTVLGKIGIEEAETVVLLHPKVLVPFWNLTYVLIFFVFGKGVI